MGIFNQVENAIRTLYKLKEEATNKVGSMTNRHEMGSSGTKIFGGFFDEEYLQQLRGSTASDKYDQIARSDDQVGMLLTARKNPILQANWFVEPAKMKDTELAQKHADFIQYELMERPVKPFRSFLEESLTFVEKGFSLFERVHQPIIKDPKFGTYIGYQKIAWRSQRTIEEWNLNQDGSIKYVRQQNEGDLMAENQDDTRGVGHVGDDRMDGRWLLVFSLNKHGDNYEGISALRNLYGNWFRKCTYQKLLAIGIERYAVGTPIGTIPASKENSPEKSIFEDVLRRFTSHESSFITLAEGWKVEVPQSPFDASAIKQVIEAENLGMAKSFMAQHLELGTGGNTGAYALGTDMSDQFLSIIQNDADIIARQMNSVVVRELIDLNFGKQAAYPKLKVTGINDKLGKEFADILGVLTDKKLITPTTNMEAWLRDQFKIIAMTDDEKASVPSVREVTTRAAFSENSGGTRKKLDAIVPFFTIGFKDGSEIKTMIFEKGKFSRQSAVEWAQKNGFKDEDVKEDEKAFRVDLGPEHGGSISSPESIFSEKNKSLKLADAKKSADVKRLIDKSGNELRDIMKRNLNTIGKDQSSRIANQFRTLPKSQWRKPIRTTKVQGTKAYKNDMLLFFSQIALRSVTQAKREIPGGSKIKFNDIKLKDLKLSEIDDNMKKLSPLTQENIKTEVSLILDSQMADVDKSVKFPANTNVDITDSPNKLEKDMNDNLDKFVGGSSVVAASNNSSAQIINAARDDFFKSPEVAETIEAFEFYNPDAVTDICTHLHGRIFDINDPSSEQFKPPLHHNCKSIIAPIVKVPAGKEITDLVPTNKSFEKQITLR